MADHWNQNQDENWQQNGYQQNRYNPYSQQNQYQGDGSWQNGQYQSGNYQNGGYQNSNYQNGYYQNGQPDGYPGGGYAGNYGGLSLSSYITRTYLWMFAGLLVTFLVAFGMAASGLWYTLINPGALVVVTIAEFAAVIAMGAALHKISPATAAVFFFLYAALTGVTFSLYFIMFDVFSLSLVFLVTAVFFGGMAAVTHIFHLELDTIRPYLFGGLILLIVFGIVSMFLNLGAANTAICYIGIAVFLGYTAYDTSKIRVNYTYYQGNPALLQKASIYSALQLYLDFINLFLYILRLFARNRNN